MPVTSKDVLTDPKFQTLSPQQKEAVLLRIDPNFVRLNPEQRQQVIAFKPSSSTTSAPSSPASRMTAVDKMFPEGATVGVPKHREGLEGVSDTLGNLRTRLSQFAQRGVGQGAGDFMTSIPQGILQILQGQAQMPSRPWEGIKNEFGGALQASQIPAAFVAPEASGLGKIKPIGAMQAARELTDAVNPPAQELSRFQRSLTEHLDKVVTFAKQKGVNIDSLDGLSSAMKGAGNWIREHYYESLLGPFRQTSVDLARIKGYAGEVSSPSTANLEQLDARLSQINAELDPRYRKASELAARAAVKSEAELNAEAAYIRKALYGRLGELTGLGEQAIADTRKSFGAIDKLAETTEQAAASSRNAANKLAQQPMTVNPLSSTKSFVGDKALAYVQGDPVQNSIRKVVGRAKMPEYELPSPKDVGKLPIRRPAPIRGESAPIGSVQMPTEQEAAELQSRYSSRRAQVLASRNKTVRRPLYESLYTPPEGK